MNKKIIYVLLIIVAIVSAIFLVSSRQLQKNKKVENVSLRLKWIDQAQFAGFYLAKDLGYYNDENLNIEIYPGGPDISPIQMVVSGVNDFGITGADQLILAREKGLPLVALAVIYKQSPVALGFLKKEGIKSPKDLENKKVGIVYGRDEEIIYRALLAKEGVDTSKIEEVPVGAGISQITSGQFNAQILYEINEPILLEQEGFEIDLLRPRDYGINFYADTLFTTEEMIKTNPDKVKAFVRASIMGWQEALANQENAIDSVLKINASLDKNHQAKFLQLSTPLIQGEGSIGHSDKVVWESMQEILLAQGIMKEKIDVDKVFTNEFLDQSD